MPAYDPTAVKDAVDYPSGDGKPMAETPTHRDNMIDLIAMLRDWYTKDEQVYVSGNMLMYYEEGNKHKHVSPDVFLVQGIPRDKRRDYYLIWEEGKGPDLVIELTSRTTDEEDTDDKYWLYQDVLRVREYFLFDPTAEYLKPPFQGYRLEQGKYVRIKAIDQRFPSEVTGLHLERSGTQLRLYDPAGKEWLLTPDEKVAKSEERAVKSEERAVKSEERAVKAETALQQEVQARQEAEAENARLRQELEAFRRTSGQS
jgi:Uma2 family endonuclease